MSVGVYNNGLWPIKGVYNNLVMAYNYYFTHIVIEYHSYFMSVMAVCRLPDAVSNVTHTELS